MKKLRLNADALRVESFTTDHAREEMGTVHAHLSTVLPKLCPSPLCQTYDDTTCGLTRGCE